MDVRAVFFALILAVPQGILSQELPPIGEWREHLPFNNALQVTADNDKVQCATPYGYFSYDKTEASFARKTKINGLSGVRVRFMAAAPSDARVALAYANGDLDILNGDQVNNIPDLALSLVSGDKTIYGMRWQGRYLYLLTGIGILVIDPEKKEVRDTWRPSYNGSDIRVNDLLILNGQYYAATQEGLKQAPANAPDLSDYRRWQPATAPGLLPGPAQRLAPLNGQPALLKNDSLFLLRAGNWQLLHTAEGRVTGFDAAGDLLYLCQTVNGKGRVTVLNPSGTITATYASADIGLPRQAVPDGTDIWLADEFNGLVRLSGGRTERIFPNSPISTSSGDMIFFNQQIWAAAGAVNDAWNYTYNPNGLYQLKEGYWNGINLYVYPTLDTLLDLVSLAGDPRTGQVYAGSFGGGLLQIGTDLKFTVYKQQSGLQPAIGDPGSYRVAGLAVDNESNLWIANYGAPQNLVLKKADGSWTRFTIPFLHTENALSQILIDANDRKWMVSPKGNGLFCLDDNRTPDQFSDDRWRYFRQGKGKGNLPSSEVYCLAEDKDGFIWIGTAKGIAVVQCVEDVFTASNCEALLPIVQQDNFAGYLFADEAVRTIAVDGANRKWVGTRNGVWLISADGTKVIHRFTEDNSPLLSNLIHRITIDPGTGEVFISTFNGICSFRGTATEGAEKKQPPLVFPNPVPPGYSGMIAIRGLVADAIVKITEADGRLVYQTRALGGQAVWNGRNYKGERMSSGAYLVLVTDENGKEQVATRIFFIR